VFAASGALAPSTVIMAEEQTGSPQRGAASGESLAPSAVPAPSPQAARAQQARVVFTRCERSSMATIAAGG
jgi:hypothetical protein